MVFSSSSCFCFVLDLVVRVTGGELFEDIVAREYYSEADARLVSFFSSCCIPCWLTSDL